MTAGAWPRGHARGLPAAVGGRPGAAPLLLWAGLWGGLNTGPWVLADSPERWTDAVHWLRALLPPACLVAALLGLLARAARHEAASALWRARPVRPWLCYGLLGLLCCAFSPEPLGAAYWAAAYLAAFAVLALWVPAGPPLLAVQCALRALRWSWLLAALLLGLLLLAAREVLLVQGPEGWTGYGVYGRLPEVAGMPMSRATGLARLAAVPCLLGLVAGCAGRGRWRWLGWGLALGSGALVVLLQARGAIAGLLGAAALVLLLAGPHTRRAGVLAAVLFALAFGAELFTERALQGAGRYLARGADPDHLLTLSGRTRVWSAAWQAVLEPPWLGRGPQADRYVLGEHVHNALLYAALQAGLPGLLLFAAGWVRSWAALRRCWRASRGAPDAERASLLAAAALLAFFTIRSAVEASGAVYAIDLLLLLPAMAHVGLLDAARAGPLAPGRAIMPGRTPGLQSGPMAGAAGTWTPAGWAPLRGWRAARGSGAEATSPPHPDEEARRWNGHAVPGPPPSWR